MDTLCPYTTLFPSVHLLANDIAGRSAAFGMEHHGCEGGENIADAVAGVRWTAGRRRGGRRLHGWHDLLSDPGGQIARRGDVKLFLATEMIGDGGHRLAGRSCNGSGAGAIEAVPAEQVQRASEQNIWRVSLACHEIGRAHV